jgi:hypothetical protein
MESHRHTLRGSKHYTHHTNWYGFVDNRIPASLHAQTQSGITTGWLDLICEKNTPVSPVVYTIPTFHCHEHFILSCEFLPHKDFL